MSNNKMLIGLDISMTSTGLCIDLNGYKKLHIITDKQLTDKKKVDGVEHVVYDRVFELDGVHDDICKVVTAENLSTKVLELITKIIMLYKVDTKDITIGIEGMSLGSKGRAMLDIPIFGAMVKRKLLTLVDGTRIKIFAPSTLKKQFTGNGRAKKPDMEAEYLERPLPILKTQLKTAKKDDIIDAIAIVEVMKGNTKS